jgi:polysaccharide deacetylase 2 family uncharacterized protein YibQ
MRFRINAPVFLLLAAALLIVAAERILVHGAIEPPPVQAALPEIAPAAGEKVDPYMEVDTPQPMPEIKGVRLSLLPFGPPVRSGPPESFGPLTARHVEKPAHPPEIAIIIDDMGMDVRHSREMVDLPAPMTLSFLPYAPKVAAMTEQAKAKGHELMIHMPMQPINPVFDLGSIALREGMSASAFDAMLGRAFESFPGYVGMNNHMGSKLTQDREAMARLMRALKKRGLFFVDSRTIPQSVAADEAEKAGVPFAVRDVFLDDDESKQAVLDELELTERIARRTGLAVAIGHPKEGTVEALREWLPSVKDKGFVLVPVSEAVRENRRDAESAENKENSESSAPLRLKN